MDGWIIADNDAGASRLLGAIRRQGIECPAERVVDLYSTGSDVKIFRGFGGLIFFGAVRLESKHFEQMRRIRAVAPEAKLVVVPSVLDDGGVLAAIRAGACDVLLAGDSFDEEVASLVERLRHEFRHQADHAKTITIVPCHSRSDANVLAVNVSAALASPTAPCGLLDFHFRGSDLALLLRLKPIHNILDLINQGEIVDEAMFRQAISPHESGVQLLAGPPAFNDMRNIRLPLCQQLIELAQRCWPVVVVNTEDIQHAEQVRAIAVSHEIVLTMRLDITSLHRAQKHLEFLARSQVSPDHIHGVAMQTGHSGELPPPDVKRFLKVKHLHCIPDDPVATIKSVNVGNPLVLESPASDAAVAMQQVAELLLGRSCVPASGAPRRPASLMKVAALACNVLPFCRSVAN